MVSKGGRVWSFYKIIRTLVLPAVCFFMLLTGHVHAKVSTPIAKPFTRDLQLSEASAAVKINALTQDNIGYIWIATDLGLVRYNGRTFVHLADSIHKPVTAVAVCGNEVYTGYSNGVIGHVQDLAVKRLAVTNGPSSSISSLSAYAGGILLATTEEQGFFVVVSYAATQVNMAKGLSDNFTYGLAVSSPGRVLIGSDMGIDDVSFADGKLKIEVTSSKQGLPDNITTVVRKTPGTDLYWVGTQESGIVIYDGSKKKIAGMPVPQDQWSYGQVNDILVVSHTHAWASTENGYLLELNTKGSGTDVRAYHYPGKIFRKLLLDRAGNIWCGTNGGLTLITGEYLLNLRPGAPYSLYETTAMAWADSSLLVALKKELYRIPLTDTVCHMAPLFTARAAITSLYIDKERRLWVGTLGDGLYHSSGPSFTKVSRASGIDDDASVLSITGTANTIWVAGLKGVDELSYPINGKISRLRHHGKKTGIGSDYVYELYPDRKGNMWMATDGAGVCMYDGSQYHHWNSSFAQAGKVAYSITEDTSGDMWAATMYKDLFHLHHDRWENLRLPETQYPDINVSAVAANATGQVISVYQRCIDEWYPQSHYFRHFNSALGIGVDSTSNAVNCLATDNAGNIYLPYQHGILVFKDQELQYDIRPSVHIMDPTIFSRPVAPGRNKFEHDENYLGFSFDGISFANHERLNFRYRLQGYNEDWIYTNDASVSFPKLSPGTYDFRVQVSLNPAFEHPNEDNFAFTIATPFWEASWFYLSSAALLLIVGYSYVKLREKRLRSISQLQQERMMFEYEHLKSQVNPHFLFNSLYALSILIEEKKENALSYTVNLADLYRNMLAYSRKNVILLSEEMEILNSYINIQQTRFGDALQVQVSIPDDVMRTKKIVPLAIQLLVENAIKHNVVSQSQPLVITIAATKDEIVVSNEIKPKISQEKGAGIGLANIRQRYSLLTKKPVTYGVFENQFIVKLPLL